MGIEGNFQKSYFGHFNDIIKDKKSFSFVTRSKRPPLDRINTLISYTNTRIYNICLAEIYKTELDPRISFLHEPTFKTVALHLDIAEIFKPYIGDNIIFTMLNNQEINSNSFIKEKGLFRFTKEAIKKIELKFINRLQDSITIDNHTITIRQLIRKEINKIKKYIVEDIEYISFKNSSV
jgi:CRISPR-associated protein Cas1